MLGAIVAIAITVFCVTALCVAALANASKLADYFFPLIWLGVLAYFCFGG